MTAWMRQNKFHKKEKDAKTLFLLHLHERDAVHLGFPAFLCFFLNCFCMEVISFANCFLEPYLTKSTSRQNMIKVSRCMTFGQM